MTINGFWTFGDNADKRHFGILTISEFNKIVLELYCDFKGEDIEKKISQKPLNVKGISDDGKQITLLSYYHLSGNGYEIYKYTLKFRYCYIGEYIENNQTPFFKNINLPLSNLFGWFNSELLSLVYKRSEREYQEKILYESSNVKIIFCYFNSIKESSKGGMFFLERKCYLKVEFEEAKKTYELLNEVKYIQLLFSILMLRPVRAGVIQNPYKVGGFPKTGELYIHDSSYFQTDIDLDEQIIGYSDFKSVNFQNIFERWYSRKDIYMPIIELLLSSYFTIESSSFVKFLNIIAAVESWHREIIQDKDPQNVSNYNQLLELIDNKELKDWIVGRNIILQSVSLPKRLDYVLTKDKYGLVKDKKKFKNICSGIRNSIAHNLTTNKKKFSPLDISLSSQILKILLESMILEEFDLPQKFIQNALERNDSFKQVFLVKELNKYSEF